MQFFRIGVKLLLCLFLHGDFVRRLSRNLGFRREKCPVQVTDEVLFIRFLAVKLNTEVTEPSRAEFFIDDIQSGELL